MGRKQGREGRAKAASQRREIQLSKSGLVRKKKKIWGWVGGDATLSIITVEQFNTRLLSIKIIDHYI